MPSTSSSPDAFAAPDASSTAVWTAQRIRALGVVTDLPTAAKILGLGRALAYDLARIDQFPVPVIRAGSRYRVPVAGILTAVGLPIGEDLTTGAKRSVDHHDEISSIDTPHGGDDDQGEP